MTDPLTDHPPPPRAEPLGRPRYRPPRRRNPFTEAALDYASRGWHVFPLRPGTKQPAVPKHPAHLCDHSDPKCHDTHAGWEQRATTDPDRIQTAWRTQPYGIGIATGPSGLVVIDLDTPKHSNNAGTDQATEPDGVQALRDLEHRHGQTLPPTFTVATPSGGRHLYYRTPPGITLANTASKVATRIDTRARGGYVVAPPTTLTDGGGYTITDDPGPPVPVLPDWFGQLLTPPPSPPATLLDNGEIGEMIDTGSERARRYVTAAVHGELARLAGAGSGTRNNTLFTAGVALGQLVGAGLLTAQVAHSVLLAAAERHVAAGAYSQTQAVKTINSGLARGQTQPRTLPRKDTHQ